MDPLRRLLIRASTTSTATAALLALGILTPRRVLAANWNRPAFTAGNFNEALKAYGTLNSLENRDIVITAPEISENGAQVPIEISSTLPGNQTFAIFVEKNPMPLAATLSFSNGALAYTRIQLKMAESSRLRVVVRTSDGKHHHATREIKVTLGGCG